MFKRIFSFIPRKQLLLKFPSYCCNYSLILFSMTKNPWPVQAVCALAAQRRCLLKLFIPVAIMSSMIGLSLQQRSRLGTQDVVLPTRMYSRSHGPWAIVAPEAKLLPGQKYYVVPISTIRKLQRLTLKYSPSSVQQIRSIQSSKVEENNGTASTCNWFFVDKSNTTKLTYASMKPITSKGGCFSDDNCFTCLLMGIKIKEKGNDSVRKTSSSTRISSTEATRLTRKRSRDFTRNGIRGSPKRPTSLTSLDHWQPSLESIKEE